jgi:hypothetical protein
VVVGSLVVWLVLQVSRWDSFLFHDAWRHNFPRMYSMTKLSGCGGLARWDGTVDSGWPVIIETVSSGLTNVFHIGYLYATGCLGLDLTPALFLFKAEILAMWLTLAFGCYVLGRVLFSHRLAAAFLFAAVLFAGVGLDDLHSDQDGTILFWLPWILVCAVQAHRQRASRRGALFANAGVLLICLQALDHYPHFPLVIVSVGALLYVALFPHAAWEFARNQYLRLWPALVMVVILGGQFWIFSHVVTHYLPSQRADLQVDLSQNGESGWVQPTVLLTSFLPVSTLAVFNSLASSMRDWLVSHGGPDQTAFIFQPNSLIYYFGFIPTIACVVFAIRPRLGRVRCWWFGFTAIIFAVAVQETHISYLMYELPFFNVFRTYSLFGLFVAFGVLVMSGYGVDALLSVGPTVRRQLLRRGLIVVVAGMVIAGAIEGALLAFKPLDGDGASDLQVGVMLDGVILVVGALTVWWASRAARAQTCVLALTGFMVFSQVVYAESVYNFLGLSYDGVMKNFGLDDDDVKTPRAIGATDPNELRRKTCDTFSVCYLSHRDAVSLHLDDKGTFFRSADEPVYQDGLSEEVLKALDGVSHPVYWLSWSVQPYTSDAQLVADLSAHEEDIGDYLDDVTSVPVAEFGELSPDRGTDSRDARLVSLARLRDRVRLTYAGSAPAYLNAAIDDDPNWHVTVNGQAVRPVRANFNGMLVPLPAGGGEVEFSYHSPTEDLFFYSRYLFLVAGLATMALLTWGVLIGAPWIVPSETCDGTPQGEIRRSSGWLRAADVPSHSAIEPVSSDGRRPAAQGEPSGR